LRDIGINNLERAFPEWEAADSIRVLESERIVHRPSFHRVYIMHLPNGISSDEAVELLEKEPSVVYAHPHLNAQLETDTYYTDQWHLNNTGQAGGTAGADIRAEQAWNIFTGSSDIKIGIFDSGVDLNHVDLAGKATGDPHVFSSTNPASWNHGTHVAGIAAGKANNQNGLIRGVDWNAQIVSKAIIDGSGSWSGGWMGDNNFASKLTDAVDLDGVDVLNHSWGDTRISQTVGLALAYAYDMNRLNVTSAGNLGSGGLSFPASMGHGIIAVGAIRNDDSRSPASSYGSKLNVTAPGGTNIGGPYNNADIMSAMIGDDADFMAGTSMASPIVAGIASLLKGFDNDLYNDDIQRIIELSADKVDGMQGQDWTEEYGYGRVNAYEALKLLQQPYELNHYTTSGSTVHNTQTGWMEFYGLPGYVGGAYSVKQYDVRKSVNFSEMNEAYIWGRGVESVGYSNENPNFTMGFTDVVSNTNNSAVLRTYVYEIWRINGEYLGWFPTTPENVEFAYTVHGFPTEIGGASEVVTFQHPVNIEAGNTLTLLAGTELHLHKDLVIESDAVLEIQAGVTINAQPGAKIMTEGDGRILAFGSPEDPIVMQGDGGGSWDGVVFNSSSNLLNNVHIKDVGGYQAAIRILGGSGNVVTSSTIEDNFYGILVDNVNSVTITGNHIVNNQNEGLLLLDVINEPSSPNTVWIRDNTIANNGSSGVYLSNSLIHDFSGNVIENNQRYGIWMSPFSTIYFNYQNEGRNRIKNNRIHQIWLASTGDAFIGGLYTQGQNSIYHTNQPSSNKYIYRLALTGQGYSQSPYNVFAQQTYWGQYAADFGGPDASWFVGNVDYSNHLTSDPTGSSGASSPQPLLAGGSGGGQTISLMSADMVASVTGGDRESLLDPQRAVQLAERVMHLRDELVNHPGDYHSARWINELFTIKMFDIHDDMGLHRSITHTFEEWSDDDSGVLAQYQGDEAEHVQLAREAAILQRVRLDLHQGDVVSALQKADRYGSQVANRDHRHALVHGLLSVAMRSGEYGAAKDLLAELELFEPEREVAGWYEAPDYRPLADYLAYAQKRSGDKGGTVRLASYEGSSNLSEGIAAAESLPEQFTLSANYPNPFNPVTVIPFTLPMQADVLIEVFDISGRRVARITDRQYEAGHHQVSFDAGSLASGVYLIRAVMRSVEGGDHQFIRKMALVK